MDEIFKVLQKKYEVIARTMSYSYSNVITGAMSYAKVVYLSDIEFDPEKEKEEELYKFFDKNFTDEEIMVLQAIMYIGRGDIELKTNSSVEEAVDTMFKLLSYSSGDAVNKRVVIESMLEKAPIGTYFEKGFKFLEGLQGSLYRI